MQKSEKRTRWKGGCEWTDGQPNGPTGKQENKELNKKRFLQRSLLSTHVIKNGKYIVKQTTTSSLKI